MTLKSLLASGLSLMSASAAPLELGAALPELRGKNQEGKVVPLTAALADEWLLIFTYPRALTGG